MVIIFQAVTHSKNLSLCLGIKFHSRNPEHFTSSTAIFMLSVTSAKTVGATKYPLSPILESKRFKSVRFMFFVKHLHHKLFSSPSYLFYDRVSFSCSWGKFIRSQFYLVPPTVSFAPSFFPLSM